MGQSYSLSSSPESMPLLTSRLPRKLHRRHITKVLPQVRQGMTIDFVFENSDDNSKKARKAAAEKAAKENARISRLQNQLTQEVVADKKKGSFFGLKF